MFKVLEKSFIKNMLAFKNTFSYSVLEQFDIIPIVALKISFFDLTITNQTVVLLVVLGFYYVIFELLVHKDSTLYIIPTTYQLVFEYIYGLVGNIVLNNIGIEKGQRYFPLLFVIFMFIVSLNLTGLLPYSFTVTSHFIVTGVIGIMLFVGINLIGIRDRGLHFLGVFWPSGTRIALGYVIAPVELISFFFKPLSLAIRLFANMMAGHLLLKVFGWFALSLASFSGVMFLLQIIPLFFIVALYFLEFAVAIIQALVFTILVSIYINDAISDH